MLVFWLGVGLIPGISAGWLCRLLSVGHEVGLNGGLIFVFADGLAAGLMAGLATRWLCGWFVGGLCHGRLDVGHGVGLAATLILGLLLG